MDWMRQVQLSRSATKVQASSIANTGGFSESVRCGIYSHSGSPIMLHRGWFSQDPGDNGQLLPNGMPIIQQIPELTATPATHSALLARTSCPGLQRIS